MPWKPILNSTAPHTMIGLLAVYADEDRRNSKDHGKLCRARDRNAALVSSDATTAHGEVHAERLGDQNAPVRSFVVAAGIFLSSQSRQSPVAPINDLVTVAHSLSVRGV
jgi:hypothetical protein